MRRTRTTFVVVALAAAGAVGMLVACEEEPPTILTPDSGVDPDSGGTDAKVDVGKPDAKADASADAKSDSTVDGGDAGDASDASDAGDASDAFIEAGPPLPICDPNKGWNTGVKLTISTLGIDSLSSVTGNETTLAWITPSDGVIHYVDHDFPQDPWGPEQTLPPTGLAPGQRVALSGDGLYLYALVTDMRSIVAFTRSSRTDPFTGPGTATLANLNAEGAALAIGDTFADLVVGASNTSLLLRVASPTTPSIRRSLRVLPSDPWAPTTAFAVQTELSVLLGQARRPTGLSADGRALFYFDEVNGHQKVGFFDYDAPTATQFVDLGVMDGAQVNGDCTMLYYGATDDLYSATKK